MYKLRKKKILILGGFGKIGFPITTGFLEQKAEVLVVTKSKQKHISKIKKLKKYKSFSFLETKKSSFAKIEKNIIKKLDKINIFVDASSYRENQIKNKLSLKSTINTIKKNAELHFGFTNLVINNMIKNKIAGSLIMISSVYGLMTPPKNLYKGTNYFTEDEYPFLKSGSISYYKFMAKKLGNKKIRLNIICPGGFLDKNTNKVFYKKYLSYTPLKRDMTSEDLKNASLFLASDLSSYITGNVIVLDGGFSL